MLKFSQFWAKGVKLFPSSDNREFHTQIWRPGDSIQNLDCHGSSDTVESPVYSLDRACRHTWVLPCVYLLSNCKAGWRELPWIFSSRLPRVANLPMIRSSGHQHIDTVPFQFLLLVSLWSDSHFVTALMSVSSTQLLELFPWRYNVDFVAEQFKAGVLYSMEATRVQPLLGKRLNVTSLPFPLVICFQIHTRFRGENDSRYAKLCSDIRSGNSSSKVLMSDERRLSLSS